MIIEFFGLPGSGKTANMKELLRHYGADAQQVLPDHGVLKNVRLVFSTEFFAFLRKILGLWLHKKHKVHYDLTTLYYYSLLYLAYMKLREERGTRFFVLDHGLVQCLSSLAWDEPKLYEKCGAVFQHISRYFKAEIRFVFTDYENDDILVKRIQTREYDVRLKHFAPEDAKRVLQTQRLFFAQAAAALQADFSVLALDSTRPLSENTERLCRALDEPG